MTAAYTLGNLEGWVVTVRGLATNAWNTETDIEVNTESQQQTVTNLRKDGPLFRSKQASIGMVPEEIVKKTKEGSYNWSFWRKAPLSPLAGFGVPKGTPWPTVSRDAHIIRTNNVDSPDAKKWFTDRFYAFFKERPPTSNEQHRKYDPRPWEWWSDERVAQLYSTLNNEQPVQDRKKKSGLAFYKKLTNAALKALLNNADIRFEENLPKQGLIELLIKHDDTVNVQGLVDEEIAVQRREDDECGSDHEEEDGGVDDGTLTEVTIEDIATGRALACADSSPPPTSPAAKRTCTEKASYND